MLITLMMIFFYKVEKLIVRCGSVIYIYNSNLNNTINNLYEFTYDKLSHILLTQCSTMTSIQCLGALLQIWRCKIQDELWVWKLIYHLLFNRIRQFVIKKIMNILKKHDKRRVYNHKRYKNTFKICFIMLNEVSPAKACVLLNKKKKQTLVY